MARGTVPPLEQVLGSAGTIGVSRIEGDGPGGRLPLTAEMLRNEPSGNIFGLTQNAGMGWQPDALGGPQFVIVSTMGGLRSERGEPIALGYHTGHWEIGLLVRGAAETLRAGGAIPFAVYCSDPCDGRTQGTTGMFDSLAYRNDAAIVMRRLIRSLPTASGVLGIATCDKGLPATMLALAGTKELPGVIVPGGVTLPARDAEDAGQVQSLGARFTHDLISLDYAATMGCRACGSSGGGCQFLGTAATSQVVAEGLGLALPHSALAPSGEPVWLELASRSAVALQRLHALGVPVGQILSSHAVENAMLVHAAFGGSTNLLLHIPAIAAAAGLKPPAVDDWIRINRATPRLVDALPNGPRGFATAQVFMAGGASGSDAASSSHGRPEHARAHGNWRHARHDARLVGIERTAPGGARPARVPGGHQSRLGDHGTRRGTPRRGSPARWRSRAATWLRRVRSSRPPLSILRSSTPTAFTGIADLPACSPTSEMPSRR